MANFFSSTCCRKSLGTLAVCLLSMLMGCHAIDFHSPSLDAPVPPEKAVPRELSMVSLPAYQIEPPDVLQIEVLKLVPRPAYRLDVYDVLLIHVLGTLQEQPIHGYFLIEGEGFITLGPAYGIVRVAGMTTEEATREVTKQLQMFLQHPEVSVQLARATSTQQLTDNYLVQSDGTINLRRYGMVRVAGKTVTEARVAIEQQLAQYFDSPEAAVTVVGHNSKVYYVISVQPGAGDNIQRFPITGNETVLDAIGRLGHMSEMSSQTMWVARANPGKGVEDVLPVDWVAISRGGITDTNFQLMEGDRLFIVEDKLMASISFTNKLTQPIEVFLNRSKLGGDTIRNMQTLGRGYNMNRSY
jgi:polysaccharide export outer membrane protein